MKKVVLMMTKVLLFLIVIIGSKSVVAQYDTLHYLPPVYVNDLIKNTNSGCRDHFLLLSTNESSSFTVTVTRGNGSTFTDYSLLIGTDTSPGSGVFNLSRSTPIKIRFDGTGVGVEHIFSEDSLNRTLDTAGFILSAVKPFFTNIRHIAGSQGASLTSKGTTAFGTNFFAGFQASGNGTSGTDNQHSHFISVMATLNNTNVTISNFKPGVTMIGQSSSGTPATADPITFSLNAGQSYIVAQTKSLSAVHMDSLSGIRITSDKDIVVNSGSWTGSSNTGGSRDIGIDQLIPATFAGDKYVLVAGKGNTNSIEKFIAISTQPDTTILTYGAGASDTIFGQGNFITKTGNAFWQSAGTPIAGFDTHRNIAIRSSQPILIFQTLFGSSSGATSSMNLIPPLADCIGSDSIYIPDASQFGLSSVVTITSPVTSSIRIEDENGDTIATIPPSTENLPGTIITDFRTNVLTIPDTVSDVLITADEKFTLGFVGASGVVGGAGYLSAFSDRDVEYSTSDPLFIGNGRARLDLCEGNPAIISIEDSENYDSFQWIKDNAEIPGELDDSLQVTAVGDYKAIATYCNLPLESTLISVDEFGSPGEQGFSGISALFESETFDGFSNGSNIVDWDEQSKDFNNASVVTNGPSVSNSEFNKPGFHPVPFFDASNSEYLKTINPISNLNGSNRYSFFMVLKDSSTTNGNAIISFENSSTGPKILKTPSGFRFAQDVPSSGGPIIADVDANSEEYIILSCVSNGTTVELYANGLQGDINFGNTTSNTLDIGSQVIIGGSEEGSTQFFDGFIAEFILFDSTLTASERQIVETYYGVKYGITFDPTNDEAGINDGDYVSNNGSIVWDYSLNSDFHNSVAGLGLDECGRLRQWQNRDANNQDVVSIGIGTIANTVGANPNSFTTDNTYFMWGRNTEAFDSSGETDFGTTLNGEVIQGRVARDWKTQETGTIGSLRIQFDLLGGNASSVFDLSDTRLLVDTDDVYTTGATSIAPTSFNNATGIVNFDHDFVPGTGFHFTLGTINSTTTPLPISLTYFTAEVYNDEDVLCKWTTESEINNAYFTIEKSLDGENWLYVTDVTGAGNSSVQQDYSCVDPKPFYGLSYYRLSQTDFDGTRTFAGIESVLFDNVTRPTISIFPNPAKTAITLLANQQLTGTVGIYSGTGQVVLSRALVDIQETEINISHLSSGVYYVHVKYDNLTDIVKLVVE